MEPEIRVILDVGAQVLELDNRQVAETWLKMWDADGPEAAVFFNNNEELSVLDRMGRVELLQTSPFINKLETCIVFLDQAHTRGTDLKLPRSYRAAVSLGANLTKDRLVQACMRMRKLGKGQSIVFLIPDEIRTKIVRFTGKTAGASLGVTDVLLWAISETLQELKRNIPLWAAQGKRFDDQRGLRAELYEQGNVEEFMKKAHYLLEPEAQSLEDRYQPGRVAVLQWDPDNANLSRIYERCAEFGRLDFCSTTLQEEQERELSPQRERERQVERPHPATADTHHLHPDLQQFVITGRLPSTSKAFRPAFQSLSGWAAAHLLDLHQFPPDLLVTTDFVQTIKRTRPSSSDDYFRSVQWILTSTDSATRQVISMVVISPFEAELLWARVKKI